MQKHTDVQKPPAILRISTKRKQEAKANHMIALSQPIV